MYGQQNNDKRTSILHFDEVADFQPANCSPFTDFVFGTFESKSVLTNWCHTFYVIQNQRLYYFHRHHQFRSNNMANFDRNSCRFYSHINIHKFINSMRKTFNFVIKCTQLNLLHRKVQHVYIIP